MLSPPARRLSPRRATPRLTHRKAARGGPRGRPVPLGDPLSEREREVLGLLAAGKTNREVAAELYVAEGTVKAHVAGIYRKLGVHSRAEAVSRAADLRLI